MTNKLKNIKIKCEGFIIPLLLLSFLGLNAQKLDSLKTDYLDLFNEAKEIRYQNPDRATKLLRLSFRKSLEQKDTLNSIRAMIELSNIYGNNANYSKSYDVLWKALALTDNSTNHQNIKARLYTELGLYYSFYKKKDMALEYLRNALNLKKKLVGEGKLNKAALVENYYQLCAAYRGLDEMKMAKVYLDSCFIEYAKIPGQIPWAQLQFENGVVLSSEKKYDKALETMESVEPWFQKNKPSYFVLLYTYWGDIYRELEDSQKSESYYKKALANSATYHSHLDFTPLIYERLANLYLDRRNFKEAYENINMAKNLDAHYFDSRSENNQSLLEVKDVYRQEKERQEKLVQNQRLEQLEQADRISLLQRIILLGAIVFFVIFGLLYVKHLRSNHKTEKEMMRRSKKMEIQKGNELLELKNKELAASALQLVEKDEFLRELKSKLRGDKGNVNVKELNRVIRNVSANNSNNWEEFKLRFTQINEKFYKKLTANYPQLSQSDQKVCALIKLNFSSKEMARLLGISVESVHTTRYRLRKKLELERNVNLEDFIAHL